LNQARIFGAILDEQYNVVCFHACFDVSAATFVTMETYLSRKRLTETFFI
jgi:hypothetical protein